MLRQLKNWSDKNSFLLTLLAGTFILMGGAFYNEFPLLTGDSAVYISSGFDGMALSERPVFYGLFIRLSSLGISLWGVVFFQSLILADLLIRQIKRMIPGIPVTHVVGLIAFTAVLTGVLWESGKIMADVFVVYALLGTLEWLFSRRLNTGRSAYLIVLILFSSITHNSHSLILLLATLVILSAVWIVKKRHYLKKTLVLLVISVLSPVIIGLSNQISGNGFTLGKATPVFLVGKMCENGMLKVFLDKHCDEGKYQLCAYRDSLPHTAWQFVWHPGSPVMKLGGWEATDKEFRLILRQSIREPEFLWMHFWKSGITTAIQLFQISAGDALFRYEENDNTVQSIRKYFPHEVNPSLWTRQRILELDFKYYSRVYGVFFLLSLIALMFLWQHLPEKRNWVPVILVMLLFLLSNAAVTANLANISSRLQARIFWIWPYLNILLLYQWVKMRFRF